MTQVFYRNQSLVSGPIELNELRSLVRDGTVHPQTEIWKVGSNRVFLASQIQGLFPDVISPKSSNSTSIETVNSDQAPIAPTPPPVQQSNQITTPFTTTNESPPPPYVPPPLDLPPPFQSPGPSVPALTTRTLEIAKKEAKTLYSDLKSLRFREEVIPIDRRILNLLFSDIVFWIAMVAAVFPLLIGTIERREYHLTAFALLFSFLWGIVFKLMIVKSDAKWTLPTFSLFFTGMIGIPVLLFMSSNLLPSSIAKAASSQSGVISLLGFVFQVGISEELTKIVPVLAYLAWYRKRATPKTAVLIGVFSGLGFAAFENMQYGLMSMFQSVLRAKEDGLQGVVEGTQSAMINVLLRSLSLVFCHAVWSGIFAYFVTVGFSHGQRLVAMFLIGLAVSALLHGTYDWLCGVQMTFAAVIVAGSFMLFYAYLRRLEEANPIQTRQESDLPPTSIPQE